MYQEIVENCIIRNLMICTPPQVLLELSKRGSSNGRGMWRTWERGETPTVFWWGNPERNRLLERTGLRQNNITS
jgi:hypothetical protein